MEAAGRVFSTLRNLAATVIVSVSLALAGLVAARRVDALAVVHGASDAVGTYLSAIGTTYAVLLAFVVYVVWSQFNEARNRVEHEANDIIDLFRTARSFPDELGARVQRHLREYVDTVVTEEWRAMATRDRLAIDRVTATLDTLWDDLHRFQPATACDQAVLGEAVARFHDFSHARANRLSASRVKIPLALKILLYVGAVVITASTYLLSVDPFWLHALITGAVAGEISHVLYIIADLDDCYSGDWQVPRGAFARLQRYMTARETAG
jgi:hypothetical protein